MTDTLYRGLAFDGQFRIMAVESTLTVQKARDLHDLSPISTILMGRMISATALLSMDLKDPSSDVSIKVDGVGPLSGSLVICTSAGAVRGYVNEPHLFFDDPNENYLIGKHLGSGTITVMKKYSHRSPAIGSTELVSGEIGDDLAYFFSQSEQIPSAVNLGILIDKEARVKASGGFILQQMPQADPKTADVLISNLSQTPNVSDLMDMGLSIHDILARFVLKDTKFSYEKHGHIEYQCTCTRERFMDALKLLGIAELETMRDGVSPVCHYCSSRYFFSSDDISQLLSTLRASK